jgi:protein-L-isoaspartate(D-aspartate) O-methyltransferase
MAILLSLGGSLSACTEATSPPPVEVVPSTTVAAAASPEAGEAVISTPADAYAASRRQMVENQILSRGVSNKTVLAAMTNVPRHAFVPSSYQPQAYEDHPLPIGHGQTISQPYIVAVMTELVDLQPGERILEIGTGSGYQAAILAEITDEVYTIEIIPELAARAIQTFEQLGYDQIVAKQGDGYWGWEEYGPFDAILVTAAPDHVPQPLVQQLADGGKMVIPIGPPGGYQSLWLFERQGDQVIRHNWGGVSFVPFTRSEEPTN